jgi:hypothetical protein
MKFYIWVIILALIMSGVVMHTLGQPARDPPTHSEPFNPIDTSNNDHARRMFKEGRHIFRFDTFGCESFWGDALQLHQAITGEKLGGVGPGISPKTALEVGLKVDMHALPSDLVQQIKDKKVDLDDPNTTVTLLKLDAVVGVRGFFANDNKTVKSIGITCALCHSTVNNAFVPGIGQRLDGWPNRDLNVGKIISLAPSLQPLTDRLGISEEELKKALLAWGPGKFDA